MGIKYINKIHCIGQYYLKYIIKNNVKNAMPLSPFPKYSIGHILYYYKRTSTTYVKSMVNISQPQIIRFTRYVKK